MEHELSSSRPLPCSVCVQRFLGNLDSCARGIGRTDKSNFVKPHGTIDIILLDIFLVLYTIGVLGGNVTFLCNAMGKEKKERKVTEENSSRYFALV